MTAYCIKIVGAHFRPPAKAILQCLPGGTPLLLTPEPDNPHDPNAIKVECLPENIPAEQHENLSMQAQGYGFSLEEILESEILHLGYIPRDEAVWLVKHFNPGDSHPAEMSATVEGHWAAEFELPEPEGAAA